MAILKLTELNTGNTVSINEDSIYRVVDYNSGVNALVIYDSSSAFLGVQKTLIATQSVNDIYKASTKLYPVLNAGVTDLLNISKTISYSTTGLITNIMYNDVSGINTISTNLLPGFFEIGINNTNKVFQSFVTTGTIYSSNANLSSSELKDGFIVGDVSGGNIDLQLPDTSTMYSELGLVDGSIVTFCGEIQLNSSGNAMTFLFGAGMAFNANMGGSNLLTDGSTVNFGKFEIFFKDSTTSYFSQLA